MNFAERIDSRLSHDSPVSIDGEQFSFASKPGFALHHESSKVVVVPDAHLLFSGEYVRIGSDLIISDQNQKFVVGNYFKGDNRPTLTSKDGATLASQIVDALTGHVHYAQATAPAAASQVIGHVLKLAGTATAIRNGVSIELNIGDAVQKGDVIQTGGDSSVGITFIDGSAFGMTSNARMVLNEMIFDPNGSSNSSLISLVQGTITFVAGQTAKNGNMRVETPVATMGIRGTAVLVEIAAEDGPTKFSVLVEPDGHTGSYNLYDKVSGQLIGTVSQAGQVTFVSSLGVGQPPSAVEQLKTLQDQQNEKALIQQVFQLYFPNYKPDDSKPKSTKHGSTSGNNLSEIIIGTATFNGQTAISQIELKFTPADPGASGAGPTSHVFYNTKAVFSADAVKSTQTFVTTEKSFKIADVVHIDDPDIGNGPFYDIATPFVAGSAVIKSAVSTNPHLDADFLSQFIHIDQKTGVVSFDRLSFNFLAAGESVTFMLEVTAQSGPDFARVTIPITITGDNDIPNGAPTIVTGPMTDVAGLVKEDTHVNAGNALETNGTITFRDVDLSDTHTASVEFTSSSSSLPGFTSGTHLGNFTIGAVSEDATDTENTGTVKWHFSLDDGDHTLQSLAEGQTITQVYTITVTDIHGALVTQAITVTITGTNDAPVLAADTSPTHQSQEVFNTTNSAVEDTVSGSLTFVDVDLSDTHQVNATLGTGAGSVVWSGGPTSDIPAGTMAALESAVTAALSDSTDTGAGSVTWTFKLPDHYLDFLADGQTLKLIYDITVKDYNNGIWAGTYSTQQVTVIVGAANDKPVITAIDSAGAVQEDVNVSPADTLKDKGTVTFADTDLTDTHTAHVSLDQISANPGTTISTALAAALATSMTLSPSSLGFGVHDFDWKFALENGLVQSLADGETITVTYKIDVQDNSGVNANDTSDPQFVTVVIKGTNDVPTITADTTPLLTSGGVVEEGVQTAGGTITFQDIDLIDSHNFSAVLTGGSITTTLPGFNPATMEMGTLVLTPHEDTTDTVDTGTVDWAFTVYHALAQQLAEGQTITQHYTVTIADGHGGQVAQVVTVTIEGTNDNAQIAVAAADADVGSVKEDAHSATEMATGTLSFTDVDLIDVHSVSAAPVATTLGTLHVEKTSDTTDTGTGGVLIWTYSVADSAIQYLAEGETKVEKFLISLWDGTSTVTKEISVTIHGTNDAPTVTVANPAADTEGNTGTPEGVTVAVATHVSISDVDTNDIRTPYVAGTLSFDSAHSSGPAPAIGSLSGLFVLNTANGTISYDKAAFDYLAEGDQVSATFTFDVSSGPDTVQKSITVVIDGINDAPVVTGAVSDPSVFEDGPKSTLDALAHASDVDHGATLSVVNVPTSLPDSVTYDPSHHTFALDPSVAAYQHLAEGATTTVTVDYGVSDGLATTPASVSWSVTGVNDAPTLSVENQYVTESVAAHGFSLTHTFTLHDLLPKDVDASSDETFTLTATATRGTLSLAGSPDDDLSVTSTPNHRTLTLQGKLQDISDALNGSSDGLTYTAGILDSRVEKINVVLTDGHGGSDTLNFIFQQNDFASGALTGTAGKDVIFSNWGSDMMTGGAGSDVFVFDGLKGRDVITDFHHGEDLITISHAFSDYAALIAHTSDVQGSAVISMGPFGPGSITIQGLKTADLHQSDFHIVT